MAKSKKSSIIQPNEEYLKDYGTFKRINTLEEFLDTSHSLPQQVAVWRSSFFHHFIYLSRQEPEKKVIQLKLIHKINKKPFKMAASLLSILESDMIARVAIKEVKIKHKHGKYELKNGFSLLDFENGVYFLGSYEQDVRESARTRALAALGLQEIYSGESCNCEHFTNWCFIGVPVSYQSKLLKDKAQLADCALNSCKGVVALTAANLAKQSAIIMATDAAAKSSIAAKFASYALHPVKSGALGVFIQAPIETITLTYSCLKMKKAVSRGMMTKSNMNKEVTKNVFGSACSIAGSFAIGTAGAAVGTLVAPGAGTIVGGTAGSIIGGVGGKFGGTLVGAGAYKIGHKAKKKIKTRQQHNAEQN